MLGAIAGFRVASGQRLATITAIHKATQDEVACGHQIVSDLGLTIQALLVDDISLEADEGVVVAFAAAHTPWLMLDKASIKDTAQHLADALLGDIACRGFGEIGMILQKALHLCLGGEAFTGEAFQGFLHHRGNFGILYQHRPFAALIFMFVPHRRLERPPAILQAGFHAVEGLLAVFIALMLRDGGEHVQHQLIIAAFTKLNCGRFQASASGFDGFAELIEQHNITRQTADIVYDHNNFCL